YFFNAATPPQIYTLSLHDALPISEQAARRLLHHEPLSNLNARDVHIVLTDTQSGLLLGYSTLKAPVSDTLPFGDQQRPAYGVERSEEHTSELQSRENLVCRLLLEK